MQKREGKAACLYQVVFYSGKLRGKTEELEELNLLEIVDDVVGCEDVRDDAGMHDDGNAVATKRKRLKSDTLSVENPFKRTRGPSKQQQQQEARRREELRRIHWMMLRSMRQLVSLHGSVLLSRKAVVQYAQALTRAPETDAQLWDDVILRAAAEGTIRRVRADGTSLKGGERDVRLVPVFLQTCGPGSGLNRTQEQSGHAIDPDWDWDRFTAALDGPQSVMHLVLWPEQLGLGTPQSNSSSKAEVQPSEDSVQGALKETSVAARETNAEAKAEASKAKAEASKAAKPEAEPQATAVHTAADERRRTESNGPVMPPRPAQNEWALFVLQERPLAVQAVMGGSKLNNMPAVGWHRASVARRDGSKADVYYFAPDGTQLRSRNDVSRWIESQPTLVEVEKEEGPRLRPPYSPSLEVSPSRT